MSLFRKSVACCIILILMSFPLLAQIAETPHAPEMLLAQNNESALSDESTKGGDLGYAQGRADGELDAKGDPLWILGGFACGCIGVGAAALTNPGPKPSVIAEMTKQNGPEYTNAYVSAYQKKTKKQNIVYSIGGWAAYMVVYFAFIYPNQKTTEDNNN